MRKWVKKDGVGVDYDDRRSSVNRTSVDRQQPNARKRSYDTSLHRTDSGPTNKPRMCLVKALVVELNDSIDSMISSPALRHRPSNGSMPPLSSTTNPSSSMLVPPGPSDSSPTENETPYHATDISSRRHFSGCTSRQSIAKELLSGVDEKAEKLDRRLIFECVT